MILFIVRLRTLLFFSSCSSCVAVFLLSLYNRTSDVRYSAREIGDAVACVQSHGSKRKKTAKRDVSHDFFFVFFFFFCFRVFALTANRTPAADLLCTIRERTHARPPRNYKLASVRLVRAFAHFFPVAFCLSRSDICDRSLALSISRSPFVSPTQTQTRVAQIVRASTNASKQRTRPLGDESH